MSEFVLAELELGDVETLRAQADGLVRLHHETPGPAGLYRATDPTGTITVTVDRAAKLVDVRISHNWTSRLTAAGLPGALFAVYTTALRTALLVEASERVPSRATAPVFEPIPSGLSEEEWEYRTRALLNETEDQLYAARSAADARPPDDEVRGRYGYLTLHLRAGGPAELTGEPGALRSADAERLRQDVLDVFTRAGLAVLPESEEDTDGDFGFEY